MKANEPKPKIVKYNKAIRDKIPEIIQISGKTAIVQTVSNNQFIEYLERKLHEELTEYNESKDIQELADLVEVVYGILKAKGVTVEQFEKVREEKNNKSGAFTRNLVLKEINYKE